MERKYSDGQQVKFVDAHGQVHDALITKWWSWRGPKFESYAPPDEEYLKVNGEPGCNLVYVTKDSAKTDPYGYQLERNTSVVHKSKQPAPGMYWCWPDEVA